MELKEMSIDQLEERKQQIVVDLDAPDADLDALDNEMRAINDEIANRAAAEAKRAEIRSAVAQGQGEVIESVKVEERKEMTLEEIRSSKEYINAFANYIRTEDDSECRALLTENVSGQVPVPSYLEGRVRTAWERLGLMNLVRKTYLPGNRRVSFELSATGAVVHTEGTTAPDEETLTFGVVEMIPASIKKWIKLSDESVDIGLGGGEAFLDYIYDELTYQIAKAAQSQLISKITALTASATSTAVGVGVVAGSPSVGIIAEALGNLSDEATNPVCVMNKATWSQFKKAQYANQFSVDPFEGLPIHFSNDLPVYSTTGTAGNTWMIVGDFSGAEANFPNGDEIRIKYDDLSLSESDLVKVVGREYVALGVTKDHMFAKVTF